MYAPLSLSSQSRHPAAQRPLALSSASAVPSALSLLALCALLASHAPLAAQTALPEVVVTGETEDPLGLDVVSSTASRTGVENKKMPASIESVTDETWTERGELTVTDIVSRTVGLTPLSSPGNGGMSFSARGFTGVNSVGVAEDGHRASVALGTVTYPNDSWGYERMDVLRGPASIVFGTGTVGGTINAIRKQPSRESSQEILVGAGQHGTARLGVGSTGALSEMASYRIDVYSHYTDGERRLGRAGGGKLMSNLRLQPSSDVQIDLIADISDQKPERYFGTPTLNGRIVTELRDQNYNANDSVVRYKDQRYRLRGQWQVNESLTVRNELYYLRADRHWKNIEGYAYTPQAGTVARSSYLEITHDLDQRGNRMEAAYDWGANKTVLGWETSKAQFTSGNNAPYGGSSVVDAFNPDRGQFNNPGVTRPKFATDTTENAFYIDHAWEPTERWTVLAGLRRDITKVSRNELVEGTPFDKTLAGNAWRLGLTYGLTPSTNLYGQISQGHDPVNTIMTLTLANRDFSLTKARQVEVGVKQQWALGEWTAAVFHIEKDNIITRDPLQPSISVQGGKQSSKGLELSGFMQPHPQWRFEGNYALVNARFDELLEAGGADRSGNRPSNVPRHTANLWAHYQIGTWQASVGARYVGKRFTDNSNAIESASFTTFDAVLAWQLNPRTTLRLIGRNLGDKIYTNTAVTGTRVVLGEGRRVDVNAEFKF